MAFPPGQVQHRCTHVQPEDGGGDLIQVPTRPAAKVYYRPITSLLAAKPPQIVVDPAPGFLPVGRHFFINGKCGFVHDGNYAACGRVGKDRRRYQEAVQSLSRTTASRRPSRPLNASAITDLVRNEPPALAIGSPSCYWRP